MGMIYLVRKKIFRTAEGMKQLYYAVQRTLQPRGGVTTEQLARRMAARKGVTEGDAHSILQDLPRFVAEALKEGQSVNIQGLGSFHVAVTSDGFEHPDDVMPGMVRLSRVYFKPDRKLVRQLAREMTFVRYPLSRYFPAHLLRPETLEQEGKPEEESTGLPDGTESEASAR